MRPPTIAEVAMAARIIPENLQAGVASMRGRNELEEFQHLPGCDGLPFCGCIEAAIRRRYPDELASLTGGCSLRRTLWLGHGRVRRRARGQSFCSRNGGNAGAPG